MAKISDLPLVETPDGSETAVVLKDGVAKRAPFEALVSAAAAEILAAMQLAGQQAADKAILAGHYANDGANADVPGGTPGERGAKYWAGQAAASAALSTDAAKAVLGWLDPVEYEACGLAWAIVDGDFRVLASAALTAPQAYFTATGLYWSGQTIGALDAVEYEACGYANPIVDSDYRLLSGTSIFVPTATAVPVVATALTWGGQSITALDPDEYEACGYFNVLADGDFRILAGTLRNPTPVAAASTVSADTLYDLAEITDGAGKTQTVSISRATGITAQISPAGSNNLARGVRSDGYAVYKSDRANAAPGSLYARLLTGTALGAEIPVIPYRKIIGIGDSLTYMGGSDGTNSAYWQLTAALLGAGWTSQGFGISGQTQDQIAARWGVLPIYVTLTGNTLPASGPVIVTAINQNPISGQIHYAIHGRLGPNGPYAKLQRDGDEGTSSNYILTQDAGGGAVAIPPGTQFIPDSAYWGSSTALIPYPYDGIFVAWMGRNNPGNAFSIVDRVQRVLATQKTLTRRFIVPLILPGVGDETGTSTRAVIEASNAAIKAAFPNNWVDFLPALQGGSNGSAQDIADVANGLIPSSLRLKDSDGVTIDFLHPNAAGRAIEAQVLRDFIVAKGWTL
ncbi:MULTISPECIES: hypothetical protein [unclassified Sphingomonas]|uniref:hypothetical protein n=1 Tax=Novosphingobium rhizosphaerae TaxID=1551649 RepID=UPI0015C6AE53